MRSTRRHGATGPIGIGLAVSVAIHVAVMIFLAAGMHWPPPGLESRAVEVNLVRAPALKPRPRGSKAKTTGQPTREAVLAEPPAAPSLPFARPHATDSAERPPLGEPSDGLRRALRASVGCDSPDALRLSPQERDACRKRVAAMGHDAPTYAVEPADPVKAAAFDREAAANARHRREREGPQTNWPCVGAWCPPCQGASCPEPLSRTFAR